MNSNQVLHWGMSHSNLCYIAFWFDEISPAAILDMTGAESICEELL